MHGDFVLYREKLCVITGVQENNFNRGLQCFMYKCQEAESETIHWCFRHELEKCKMLNAELLEDDDELEKLALDLIDVDEQDIFISQDCPGDDDDDEEVEKKKGRDHEQEQEDVMDEDEDDMDRFADLNPEEVDEIAAGRLAKGTKKKTKWAVTIFKGKYSEINPEKLTKIAAVSMFTNDIVVICHIWSSLPYLECSFMILSHMTFNDLVL